MIFKSLIPDNSSKRKFQIRISLLYGPLIKDCHVSRSRRTQWTPILSLFPSSSLPDALCDPTDLVWRQGSPFVAMTGRTAPSSDGLLAAVFFRVFFSCKANARRSVHSPRDHFIITLIIDDNLTDVTLGASGLWPRTRIGAGGTVTLT